jgi:hypothetical protein
MKSFFLGLLVIGSATGAYAQGFVFLDNINNTATSPSATSGGLFFINTGAGPVLQNGDFNAAFYGGTDSANLSLIASFSGAAAVGSGGFGPGFWLDPTGKSYPIPGSTTSAFFQIQAWMGTATSYASATGAKGQSAVFNNPVAQVPTPPPDFANMPAVIMVVPEPSTFALAGLGAAALLIFRRRK